MWGQDADCTTVPGHGFVFLIASKYCFQNSKEPEVTNIPVLGLETNLGFRV